MTAVKTDTFSVDIPEVFESVQLVFQSLRAEHVLGEDSVTLIVGLSDDRLLRKQPGDTQAERFRAWSGERRGPAEVIAEQVLSVDGRDSHVVTVRAETGYAFYFAMVPADEGFHYELTGDCPVGLEAEYFPWFEQTLLSLHGFGDLAPSFATQQASLDKLVARFAGDDAEASSPEPAPALPPFVIPADGQETLSIGGHRFAYLPTTEIGITAGLDTGGELVIDLKARVLDDASLQLPFLNDYEHGQIYLRFSVKNVYRAGAPVGRFVFDNDRDPDRIAYLWKGGFHYSVNLFGDLVLEDGWVGFSGYLEGGEPEQRHVVSFAKQLPLASLDWTSYRFTSLAELFSAPVDLPRHLYLNKPGTPSLPDALFDYTALQSLHIACTAGADAADAVQEIPPAIARLQRLQLLSLTSMAGMREIPAALGELLALRRLHITKSQATSVPQAVLALPALEFCTLSHNQLQHLPEHITPSLKRLSVDDNQLTTVPDILGQLPQLEFLEISQNPLVSLPPGLEGIATLRLELDKKFSFFDYTYRGAGGRGTISFDREAFLARQDAALIEPLDALMEDEEWAPYRGAIRDLALHAVALETTEPDDYGTTGNSRFGGLPDLPGSLDYPSFLDHQGQTKGYQFIAQLNCAELAAHQAYLPRAGMLYFFITGQDDIRGHVFHVDGAANLRSASTLSIAEEFIDDEAGIYPPYRVASAPCVSVPTFYSTASYALGGGALDALEEEDPALTESLIFGLEEAARAKPVHAINSYVFKQHDTPEIDAADALRGRPEDFMVLLRVSSDSKPGFCFWDAGEIYFVIHKSDLAQGDFSNVYCGLESS